MKFTIAARDILAALLIVGCFFLRFQGINSLTEYILVGIVVVYFGVSPFIPRGKGP